MSSKSQRSGRLFVISAPSGAGKTSLVNALLQADRRLVSSVSHTTRPKRQGEKEGKHYYFTARADFLALKSKSTFLEHANVFGHLYGTSAESVDIHLTNGLDVILEIDWQGARKVREREPATTSIFVLPPSRNALVERLRCRGEDSPEEIRRRTNLAVEEISHFDEFDYVLVNDNFDETLLELKNIISSVRNGTFFSKSNVSDLAARLLSDKTRFE
jgi:guanylate kinase